MDNGTIGAVIALLERAEELGIGVAFIPDDDGWTIARCRVDWPAAVAYDAGMEDLASGYMLEEAALGAVVPLNALAVGYGHYQKASPAVRTQHPTAGRGPGFG
jgi:hypothetical protein